MNRVPATLQLSLALSVALLAHGCCWKPVAKASGEVAPPVVVEAPVWPAQPVPGPPPAFTAPSPTRFVLANGIPVTLVQTGAVPLIQLQLNVYTGSSADPKGKEGLASVTADLLNEGTKARDALQLEHALQMIASDVSFGADLDASSVRVEALEDKLAETLAIVNEMLTTPTFPEKDLARVIEDRKRALLAAKDELPSVGTKVFRKLLWGDSYFGRPGGGTEASLAAIQRKDVVGFHGANWGPSNAGLIVVTRLSQEQIQPILESTLGTWKAKTKVAPVAVTVPARRAGVSVVWVDRPGATQSYVVIGNVGPAFDPVKSDQLRLGNYPLGGAFTARINMNLREAKGYTYGARSGFRAYKRGGEFVASASVKADTTAASIQEFLFEIQGVTSGARPVTEDEHRKAVGALVQAEPGSFEAMGEVLAQFAWADAQGWPAGHVEASAARVASIPLDVAQRAFADVVKGEDLLILVVGDRALAGPAVEALGLGPIDVRDDEGRPLQE